MINQFARFFEYDSSVFTQLEAYAQLIKSWNQKINLVSRKDIDFFEEKHILPVLPIKTWNEWTGYENVIDVGTGGGIPGIPLAILFPHTQFTLIDSIGKKIKAVAEITSELGLQNVVCKCIRLEDETNSYNAIVGRAVTAFDDFFEKAKSKLTKNVKNSAVFYWSGGELNNILKNKALQKKTKIFDLQLFFQNNFCHDKKILKC